LCHQTFHEWDLSQKVLDIPFREESRQEFLKNPCGWGVGIEEELRGPETKIHMWLGQKRNKC
jgi:hypothetical protein